MPKSTLKTPLPAAGWIVLCAFLNCAGWALSAAHELNRAGYAVLMLGGLAAAAWWWRRAGHDGLDAFRPGKLTRRFRRPFAAAFLVLAALAFLGGAIHAPNNYDALAYRLPRILNWLAAGQWHWIHTDFQRLNVRAAGYEWVAAPLMLFTKSDRLLFLINLASFLLLPGLVFSVFTRLGVGRRAAWYWMWLLPSGYGFLLQAGSIGNDLFGAVFALAAVDFALRAKASMRVADLWLSCLAAALLTGGKTSNLPLLLPWLVAILPALPLIRRRLVSTIGVGVIAAAASFLPVAVANFENCGDWTGQKAEQARFTHGEPVLFFTQNAALLAIHNLAPPVFPMAGAWNGLMRKITPSGRQAKLDALFEPVGAHLAVGEMEVEEGAGIGFGVSLMVLATMAGTWFSKRAVARKETAVRDRWFQYAVLLSAWVAILPYMTMAGTSTPARLVLPYYGLMLPLCLRRQTGDWLRRNRWWQWSGLAVFVIAAGLLVLSPARPLWPAQLVLSKLDVQNSAILKRAEAVYSVYHDRPEAFAPARDRLPPDASPLGLISFDYPEASLWKPFGGRRILHVRPEDGPGETVGRGIRYVLVSSETLLTHTSETPEQWLQRNHAEVVWAMPLRLRASREANDWILAKLPAAGTKDL